MPPSLERQVLDALPIAVYTVDLDGRITFTNRSPLVGASIVEALADVASRDQIEQAMATLREGRASSIAWEISRSSTAEARVFLMQVNALGDSHAVAGFAFSAVDITPSHRWRESLIDTGIALARTISVDRVLQEVAQHLRGAVASDAIAIALADGETAALRLVHHAGFADGPDVIAAHLAPVWADALRLGQVVERPSTDGIELTAPMTCGEGVLGAITLTATPLGPHRVEESRRVLATVAAQTAAAIERARLVQRVGHKRRLEAIGEVSAGVAHELRNPLFGISSAAQLLRFRVKDDPVVEKNVGRILREVERLNSMVTGLLEYGRIGPIRLQHGDPDDVWDEVLASQRGLLESRAVLLERTRATRAVCAIDSQQLAQVFINLLANATDAAPEGSDLTLSSSILPTGMWRCRLHNGGTAIPPEVLPRVFEVFFSTKPGGTGIGLALCQRIVEEHGGTISLDSVPDRGTTASIMLPLVSA